MCVLTRRRASGKTGKRRFFLLCPFREGKRHGFGVQEGEKKKESPFFALLRRGEEMGAIPEGKHERRGPRPFPVLEKGKMHFHLL